MAEPPRKTTTGLLKARDYLGIAFVGAWMGGTITRVGNGGDNPFEVQPADVLNASHLFDGSKDPPPGVRGMASTSAAIKR